MKKLNLLGIRKKALLCLTKGIAGTKATVMRAIDDAQEHTIDTDECISFDDNLINRADIYIYGEVNLDSEDDIAAIRKFKLINDGEHGCTIHSNFNYETGEVEYEEIPKMHTTWDAVEWFKYNYCMLGKPKKIIIYRIDRALM